jgi:hypothetical protein
MCTAQNNKYVFCSAILALTEESLNSRFVQLPLSAFMVNTFYSYQRYADTPTLSLRRLLVTAVVLIGYLVWLLAVC